MNGAREKNSHIGRTDWHYTTRLDERPERRLPVGDCAQWRRGRTRHTGRRGLAEHHAHQKTENHQRRAIPENAWVQIEAIQLSNGGKLERVTRHGTQAASVATAARGAGGWK